ncbi:MAG: DUF2203 family protein [Planctomycetota bacterium]
MKLYSREIATQLLPLLAGIGREIRERESRLTALETELALLQGLEGVDSDDARTLDLIAEMAVHRRELRFAEKELERLGCTVVGHSPLTIRIPGRVGETKRSFVWQSGDAVLN